MHCISAHHFTTAIVVIVYHIYHGRLYISLFDDVCINLRGLEL